MGNRRLWPVYMLVAYDFIFAFLRYFYLKEYPENSYAYLKVSSHPHYLLDESLLLYLFLNSLWIVGYLIGVKVFPTSLSRTNSRNDSRDRLRLFYLFSWLFLQALQLVLILVFKEVPGASLSITNKIFIVYLLFPSSLISIYLIINYPYKWFYALWIASSAVISVAGGSKAAFLMPFVLLFITNAFLGRSKISAKLLFSIIFALVLFLGLFPFVYYVVGDIRHSGGVSWNEVVESVNAVKKEYSVFFNIVMGFLYKRLTQLEFLQVIVQSYSDIDRMQLHAGLLPIHIANEFLPSFLQNDYFYESFNMNRLYGIVFLDQPLDFRSSECLTFPGFSLLYFDYWAPIFSMAIGFFFSIFLGILFKIKNHTLSALFSIYFIVKFVVILQSASVPQFFMMIKDCIGFLIVYFTITEITKTMVRRNV